MQDLERLLDIKAQMENAEQLNDVESALASDSANSTNKIQYVLLLEKKLAMASWELEEVRAEGMALKLQKNNDMMTNSLKKQLSDITNQRDELLRERGTLYRENEGHEKGLITQIERLSRERDEMALESKKIESDCANRVETLYGKVEVLQRQRDDLLTEQRMWRREKEELVGTMMNEISLLKKQNESLSTENKQLKSQLVHLTPINPEATTASTRFKAAPAGLGSAKGSTTPDAHGDAVPQEKPPSASLKAKLQEWNRQREKMTEEQIQLNMQVCI